MVSMEDSGVNGPRSFRELVLNPWFWGFLTVLVFGLYVSTVVIGILHDAARISGEVLGERQATARICKHAASQYCKAVAERCETEASARSMCEELGPENGCKKFETCGAAPFEMIRCLQVVEKYCVSGDESELNWWP